MGKLTVGWKLANDQIRKKMGGGMMGLTTLLCFLLDQVKCAQYWPQREEREAVFEDTNFKLTLISEDVKSYYTVRQLELENLSVRNFTVFVFFCFFK